ncbi:uncharacterized protein K441DRAFT_707275 [Cenococcum geophilum 1.58]|uniref:uncharacterized protein n=1 Tax=Cenococcum geophilum 1.58 TaxID=794803 RepID=UPI00358EDBCC|nr:hypothetical protein K441DRAFT_707275 [Cenococcum geophilum 1.58]
MGEGKGRGSSSKKANTNSSGTGIVQHPNSTLANIRSLRSQDVLVLFTPVVPPPPGDATVRMDPFEPLGHALSKHHKRIRHVPYVPSVGMTETHLAFLQRGQYAGAVVVVVCDHPNATSVKGNGYDYQRAFAQAALDQISSNQDIPDIPTFLVLITGNQAQRGGDFSEFEGVLQSDSYTPSALQQISNRMFGA